MLWGIDPLLDADLLYALRRMGHGDEIAIVDANFPASSTASSTVTGQPIPMSGVSAARAVEAVLSVMPLDSFVPDPACVMQVVGDPAAVPPVCEQMNRVLAEHGQKPATSVERHAFYAAAESAYAIVRTGERRFYGNILLTKGVIPPESA